MPVLQTLKLTPFLSILKFQNLPTYNAIDSNESKQTLIDFIDDHDVSSHPRLDALKSFILTLPVIDIPYFSSPVLTPEMMSIWLNSLVKISTEYPDPSLIEGSSGEIFQLLSVQSIYSVCLTRFRCLVLKRESLYQMSFVSLPIFRIFPNFPEISFEIA